jgi:hypothetical protein
MPSKSQAQHNLMAAVAHNPEFARKVGISQSIGREFIEADKRKGSFKRKSKKRAHLRRKSNDSQP